MSFSAEMDFSASCILYFLKLKYWLIIIFLVCKFPSKFTSPDVCKSLWVCFGKLIVKKGYTEVLLACKESHSTMLHIWCDYCFTGSNGLQFKLTFNSTFRAQNLAYLVKKEIFARIIESLIPLIVQPSSKLYVWTGVDLIFWRLFSINKS